MSENSLVIASSIHEALAANPKTEGMRLSTDSLSRPQTARLVYYSTNPDYPGQAAIEDNTSDPARFGSIRKVKEWEKKGRTQVHLEPGKNDLYALCWEGEEEMPVEYKNSEGIKAPKVFINGFTADDAEKFGITYAIRTYGRGNGARASVPVTSATREVYRQTAEYDLLRNKGQNHDWLEVSADNAAGIASYERTGCIRVTEPYVVVDKYTGVPHAKINMVFPEFKPYGSEEKNVFVVDLHAPKAA